ncbi:hypothetical protein GCM10018785_37780 [Streptomyces longispororuber]|uniref:Integral membrane protein n=1 Tax=Streptomyces longispororuber TaxID=68230 RepID=A0A919DP67_9ACTN|nr:hypothetical protein [Streptomyces longispororuber]GHE65356.1 hypothetical protein GCM10018785_37780 [Streptomyces longispororuber]
MNAAAGAGLALVAAAGAAGVSAAACRDPAGGPGVPRLTLLGWGLALAAGAGLALYGTGARGGDPRPGVTAALLVLGTGLLCAGTVAVAAVVALCLCAGAAAYAVSLLLPVGRAFVPGGWPVGRRVCLCAAASAAGVFAGVCWLPQARGAVGVVACAVGLLWLAREVRPYRAG